MSVRSARRVATNARQIAVALAPLFAAEAVTVLPIMTCGCGADAEVSAPGTGDVCGGCMDVAVRVAPELVGPITPLFA